MEKHKGEMQHRVEPGWIHMLLSIHSRMSGPYSEQAATAYHTQLAAFRRGLRSLREWATLSAGRSKTSLSAVNGATLARESK
jgi:hypothetical protein